MDVKNYCLEEICEKDQQKSSGGFLNAVRIATGQFLFYFALQVAIDPQAHIDAFKEGWEKAGND